MTDGQKGVLHALVTQHETELQQALMDYGLLQFEDVGPGLALVWVASEDERAGLTASKGDVDGVR